VSERAAELRDAFDRAFAEAPAGPRPAYRELLRVRLAGEPFALALVEIAAIHVDREVVAMPATARELLGVIAVRAQILPVYDLRAVVGAARELAPRWLVIARHAPVAFAFDGFDGLVRVAADAAVASSARFASGVVTIDGRSTTILDLEAACAAVHKER
jgi:chemotaxis signal transduction protein